MPDLRTGTQEEHKTDVISLCGQGSVKEEAESLVSVVPNMGGRKIQGSGEGKGNGKEH